jgi:hypothetical protein
MKTLIAFLLASSGGKRNVMNKLLISAVLCCLAFACGENPTGSSGTAITAAERLPEVNAYVGSLYPGARLFSTSASAVDPSGRTRQWSYCYVDTAANYPLRYIHATCNEIAYDSTSPMRPGPGVITLRWLDSDAALLFAELNGGSGYRTEHPDYWISARLSQVWTPDPHASWWVFYHSSNSIMLGVQIDAVTGAKIGQTR